jgi:hypothetical protein
MFKAMKQNEYDQVTGKDIFNLISKVDCQKDNENYFKRLN